MRILVAAGSVALVLYACTTSETPDPDPPREDAGYTPEASPEADPTPAVWDGATEPDADAGPCLTPPLSIDDAGLSCYPLGPCPTCASGLDYKCAGGGRPLGTTEPVPGCRNVGAGVGAGDGYAEYCCPAACVRSIGYDSRCVDAGAAFACPSDPSGTSLVGIPTGCKHQPFGPDYSSATPFSVVCCD